MAEAVLEIRHWGNGLGVRLPAAVARAARMHADEKVRLTVKDGNIIITPLRERSPTLAERLAQYDPARHGGEAMPVDSAEGAERW